VKFIALPPNATLLLQALDVAFLRPLKCQWRKILDEWKVISQGSRCSSIPKDEFPRLLEKLIISVVKGLQNLVSGFRKSGIIPVDRSQGLARLPTNMMKLKNVELMQEIGNSFMEELTKKREEVAEGRQ
jgi:hypothetical protein